MTPVAFNLSGFTSIVDAARAADYDFVRPGEDVGQGLLLRHDVDLSLRSAAQLAEYEATIGVSSTYFIMVRSAFYSVTSPEASGLLRAITESGHAIGLHWDAGPYHTGEAASSVSREIDILQWLTGMPCIAVSHHQPSLNGLVDIEVPGVVNMYGRQVQEQFRYISDSCMSFREDPLAMLARKVPMQVLLQPEYWTPGGDTLEGVCANLARQEAQVALQRFDHECALMQQTVRRRAQFDGDLRQSMTPRA